MRINRRLLLIDFLLFALGVVLLCVVQLLIDNMVMSSLFEYVIAFILLSAVGVSIYATIKDTDKAFSVNIIIPVCLAVILVIFYSLPIFNFQNSLGINNTIICALFIYFIAKAMYYKGKDKKTEHNRINNSSNSITDLSHISKHMMYYVSCGLFIFVILLIVGNTIRPTLDFSVVLVDLGLMKK